MCLLPEAQDANLFMGGFISHRGCKLFFCPLPLGVTYANLFVSVKGELFFCMVIEIVHAVQFCAFCCWMTFRFGWIIISIIKGSIEKFSVGLKGLNL